MTLAVTEAIAADWPALHSWSVTHRDQFWQEMLDFARIRPRKSSTSVAARAGIVVNPVDELAAGERLRHVLNQVASNV